MSQAAVFLAGSILTMLSFIVLVGGVVIINNILANFWKPVTIFSKESWFVNPHYEVKQEPKKD